MRRLAPLLACGLAVAALAGCGGGSSSSSAPSSGSAAPGDDGAAAAGPPELQAAVAKAAASGVPVRIPPALLESPPAGANHAEVLRSPPDSYTLGLASRPECRFESDCVVAIFSGSAGNGELSGRPVELERGIEGSYEPGRCGPGCEFGTVSWRQDGYLYGVGVPNASVDELAVLAGEAIAAEPVAETPE